ncbi:MAG: YciI family protein [Archangium sp.]|nr:YciI family protein [Archangium sp.]MDP3153700.1 YciI family protein [Archangium sp.]MDP3569251.1 YciI family protein [Archangium sp.]
MKFMLLMNTPGNGPYQVAGWARKDLEAHINFMKGFAVKLAGNGELLSAQGLAGPDQAKLVKAGPDGEPVTDGVFPESKEFLAGFWLVDVETAERAYRIAAEASMAPGPGGKPMHLNIEVREVMSAPPTEQG